MVDTDAGCGFEERHEGVGRLNPQRRAIYGLCTAYVAVIRGTPLLVQLFILFFGLPQFGVLLPAFVCGVIGLGIYSGAYVSEIVRGAIQSIDRGQMEAVRAGDAYGGIASGPGAHDPSAGQ